MTDTRTNYSDAYYMAQLLERLEYLEKQLSSKIGPNATLTQRAQTLLKDLHYFLSQKDSVVYDMLELSLLPKINRLLMDARQEFKLKNAMQKAFKVGVVEPEQTKKLMMATPTAPTVISEEERHALIEDALTKLKMLLSQA